jgi:tetratricopeptide (TPR) repeat protein
MLEALDGMLDDADVAYNHGICLSELGRTEESVTPLRRCLELDPGYTNAAVGLGVAFARLHRDDEAAEALRTALAQDPGNVFALRNLAAVLGRQGRLSEALPLFRQALAVAPAEAEVRYALAQCLEQLGGEHRAEAKSLYKQIIQDHPRHPVADAAIASANRMAGDDLHGAVEGKPRMDAVMYMQGAMDTFADLPRDQVGQIVMEIARLGQSGLAINDASRRYSLKSLPGDYSGLHLICLMHVGVRLFDPSTDPGTGLQREYELALAMRGASK